MVWSEGVVERSLVDKLHNFNTHHWGFLHHFAFSNVTFISSILSLWR